MTGAWCPSHPCVAVIAPFSLSFCFFLPFCFFPLCESTGVYDGRSPVRLVNWLQVLRLPALLRRAAKSPLPAAYHKTQCLFVSLSPLLIPPPYEEIQMSIQQTAWEGEAPELPSDAFAWVPKAVWPQGDVVDVAYRSAYQCCQKVSYPHLQ